MGYQLRPNPDQTARLQRVLEQIVERLASTDVQLAVLFGSLARGEVGACSDIDLLVVRPTDERFVRRADDLASLFDAPVGLDILVYTPEEFEGLKSENPLIREACATGKVIYEAHPGN